jgi:hypothetical protein
MTEEEWTEWFTHAIDDLFRGEEPPPAPTGLDARDLESLLQVARLRLDAGRSAQAAGAEYEPEVWQRLIARIESGGPAAEAPAQRPDLPEGHHEELQHIVSLRMELAREAMMIAEAHKDDVWERVRARVGDQAPGKRWLSMFPPGQAPEQPPPGPVPETQRHFRERSTPTDEAVLNEMAERAMQRLAEIATDPVQVKIRARMRGEFRSVLAQEEAAAPRPGARLIAAVGAMLVLAVAVALIGLTTGIVQASP